MDANCDALHTPNQPEGYLQWHHWARRMSKTHYQFQCPECGLWTVWRPKNETLSPQKQRKLAGLLREAQP